MRTFLTVITAVLLSAAAWAQSPQKMSYQAVIRNSSNQLVTSQAVGMRISILQGSVSGTVVYSETLTPATNANGLVSVEIGGGTGFASINWANGPYFIKAETDPAGGTNYTIVGTSQVLSVPYAIHSKTAETLAGGITETDPLWTTASANYYTKTNMQTNGASQLHFNNLTNKPTTVADYGISDAMTTAHAAYGITSTNITNWNTAFGWGNHAGLYRPISYVPAWVEITSNPFAFSLVANNQLIRYNTTSGKWENWTPNFLTSYTETDPLWISASANYYTKTNMQISGASQLHFNNLTNKPTTVAGYGISDAMTTAHAAFGITSTNITNWNTAFGWGNHAGLYKPASYFPFWSEITGIPSGFADELDNVDDADNNPTNEIQTMSITGNNLSLSKEGGTVIIPGDRWGTQVVVTDATLTGNGTVTTPLKIADSGVSSGKILDGTIVSDDLANNSVTSAKIPDGSVVNADIADNAVNSIKIQDGSVSTADIAAVAITTEKMAGNAVTVAKLPPGAAADKYLRGDGTWANPPTGITTETDPTWSGAADETVATGRTGNVGIGTTSPAALLHTYGTGNGQGNVVFVGQFKEANPGNPPVSGAGTRMMWYPDKAAFRAGKVDENQWDAANIGNWSAALGYGCKASGICAFATGFYTTASNYMSTAIGYRNTASGQYSTAMGSDANATGYGGTAIGYAALASGMYSTALGVNTIASGDYSTAMGTATTASSYFSTAVGRWNVGGGNRMEWIDTDPLFEIGNGSSYPSVQPHNAMTVLKNGYTGIGTNTPSTYLHILGNSGTTLPQLLLSESEADYARLSFKNTAATTKNWSISGRPDPTDANSLLNFWYWNGTSGADFLSIKGNGNVGIGTTNPSYKLDIAGPINLNKGLTMGALYCNGSQALWFDGSYYSWGYGGGPGTTFNYFANPITIGNAANPSYMLYVQGNAHATGTWSSSDARFKKNILTIERPMDKIMKTRGVSFEFRKDEFKDYQFADGTQFGFIAQELEKVFPEMVNTDSNGYKSINYSEMIPVLIEAVKEQQNTIEKLEDMNNRLKVENAQIITRLEHLENITETRAMK